MLIDRRTERAAASTPVAVEPEGGEAGDPDDEPGDPPSRLRVPSPFLRPWRLAAGAAFGAATAVKWSGAMAIPAAVLLTYIWETTRRRREGRTRKNAFVRTLGMETLGVVIAFAIVPLLVYTLAWIPWFTHFEPSLADFLTQHRDMWRYHRDLRATALDPATDTFTPTHVYYSKAWT